MGGERVITPPQNCSYLFQQTYFSLVIVEKKDLKKFNDKEILMNTTKKK